MNSQLPLVQCNNVECKGESASLATAFLINPFYAHILTEFKALYLTLISVFSAVESMLFLGEQMAGIQLIGGACILMALVALKANPVELGEPQG